MDRHGAFPFMAAGNEMSPTGLTQLLGLLGTKEIFEIITDAIAVAAHDHPRELAQRRDSILQMLDAAAAAAAAAVDESSAVSKKVDDGTKNQPAGDGNGPASSVDDAGAVLAVSEEVARINGLLLGRPSSDEAVLESLRALKAVPMTFETLEATKIGRAVSGLRKHASEKVRELAGDLYKGWKALADEHFRSSRTSLKPTNTAGVAPAANAEAKMTAAPKPSACERKEAPMIVIDEARLATAKRKLHYGYEEAATAKKQRSIQVISTPLQKTRQRTVVRRHCNIRQRTAADAGRSAPAASLRMCF